MTEQDKLAIEWACSRLITVYASLVDAGRWEEVAALYLDDGIMARPSAPDELILGRDAILATFLDRPMRYARHFCANIVVDVETPTSARAQSRILLFTAEPGWTDAGDAADLPRLSGLPLVGEYSDRLVLGEGGWRFAERLGRLSFRP
jgi:hypothetical protein